MNNIFNINSITTSSSSNTQILLLPCTSPCTIDVVTSKKIPTRNKTIKVRLYYNLKDEKAICQLCKSVFSHKINSDKGSITRHLNKAHGNWDYDDNLLDDSRQQNLGTTSGT